MAILSWMENAMKDERPPEYLWEDTQGLEEWWARVAERREARYGAGSSAGSGGGSGDADQSSDMAENEIAKALKG